MTSFSLADREDISIVLCGAAGQGIKTVELFLTEVLHEAGYHVTATKEYMSRVRGGTNSTEIRVSSKRVRAFIDRIDILIPLNETAVSRLRNRISKNTIIIGESEFINHELDSSKFKIIEIPWTQIARDLGNQIYSNIIAAGVITELFNVEKDLGENYINNRFMSKGKDVLTKNIEAFTKGCEIANRLKVEKDLKIAIQSTPEFNQELMYDGASIVGMGAIAGGCDFICSYPMSPSTGVLIFLAKHSHEFDILVEQAEDEIAAINAGLGASYAGARVLVSTSGGGFALMGEGLSLSGMTEIPIVIHLAQRPGPATGLPTRTEQGDLELALYSGHGDFPRIILAPSTLEDAFFITQEAFNIAAKYQVPVIILTDQYFMDLYYNFPKLDISNIEIEKHIIKTDENYQRYLLTNNGISPRGIPSYGEGLVRVDSDEHDENGFITEDLENIRPKMVEKRMNRLKEIEKGSVAPCLLGPKKYTTLLIGWGSTFNVIKEALDEINDDTVALLHFTQLYPLAKTTKKYLEKAEKLIIIENNATSQFAKLLKLYTGFDIENKILKYNGMPFSVEELSKRIKKILEGK
ncbi:MAG: 2-oxoacid:acceptor oxidoreductase subunit alpha [Candidatus Heimdallarchaeota archaeon]|nr:2-oxoacid:acceptor oxidoreductase subunit alpha [Candidatus Heimdallarchaeota archaeon]